MPNKPGRPLGSTRGRKKTIKISIPETVWLKLKEAKPEHITWAEFFENLLKMFKK